jgi:hypothetical protein
MENGMSRSSIKTEYLKAVFNRPKKEIEISRKDWDKLVKKRLHVAEKRGLHPRYINVSEFGDQAHYTLVSKGSLNIIFICVALHSNTNEATGNPHQDAIILEQNKKPRYAERVTSLENLGRHWSINGENEKLETMNIIYGDLKKETSLFDSRKMDSYWKAPYPDIEGLMKTLKEEKTVSEKTNII